MEILENKKAIQLKKSEQLSYKMIITKELERKIRFICSKINNIEWSGVLFYTHEGEFEDGSLTIKAVDLIVLDIGDATTTQFQCSNPDVITYMVDNDLLDCDMALIHSHHTMSTFMSGTDLNTLLQEGTDRNIFVSLIVNNAGTYTAGITRRIFSKITEEKCYKTFQDKEICKPEESYETEYVEWFNLSIEKEEDNTNLFPEIAERLANIAENKKKQEEERKKSYVLTTNHNDWDEEKRFDWQRTAPITGTNQPTLFDYTEEDIDKDVPPTNEDFIIDTKAFNDIVIKLLTGDITADSTTTTITRAAANMSLVFDRTFKEMEDFEAFASNIIDFIIDSWGNTVYIPKNTEDEDAWIEATATFAYDLSNRLLEVTPNKYTEIYSNILNNYL